MADKPYTERTGGSYIREKETGNLTRAEDAYPKSPAEQKPATSTEKKGK